MNRFMENILSWIVSLLTPGALIILTIRLLLTPVFTELEYRMPGFPPDEYGFTQVDRLEWSKYAINYLVNSAGIDYLGDLKFPDGAPLYNERELNHMQDVKVVTQAALKFGYIDMAALASLGVWAWFGNWKQAFKNGLRRGGWVTLALMGTIVLFSLVSFWQFFVLFHSLFFEGDSWLFLYTDTLIRLFPLRFWQDVFIVEGVLVLAGSLALALGLKPRKQ
ncbi:MAG: TIGR01906 family membrane protein [Anaerolineales bacterium]|nr:TIGR01906 family membrane protein [Anaerolineales bacterium]